MIWAPCCFASWAYCSCFWIIDSLSPVQVACSSAPRTLRAMCVTLLGVRARPVRRALGRRPVSPAARDGKDTPRRRSREPSGLEAEHRGERGCAAGVVELDQEHVVEGAAAGVGGRPGGAGAWSLDRPRRVRRLVGTGLV